MPALCSIRQRIAANAAAAYWLAPHPIGPIGNPTRRRSPPRRDDRHAGAARPLPRSHGCPGQDNCR
eukprot:356232-Chlamydomonas_euryale.AAC.5